MSEIIFRLPSKQVQYGYVEVKGDPEDFGITSLASAQEIGQTYALYVKAYLEGELEGAKLAAGKAQKAAVAAELSFTDAGAQPTQESPAGEDAATALLKSELGATVVSTTEAPYNQEPPAAKAKPWEKTAPQTAVADIDWS